MNKGLQFIHSVRHEANERVNGIKIETGLNILHIFVVEHVLYSLGHVYFKVVQVYVDVIKAESVWKIQRFDFLVEFLNNVRKFFNAASLPGNY